MFFKMSRRAKFLILGTCLFSISINGMANKSAINLLLKSAHENKGKLLLVSGAIATVWIGYCYWKPIRKCLKSFAQNYRDYLSSDNTVIINNGDTDQSSDSSTWTCRDQKERQISLDKQKTITLDTNGNIEIYAHDMPCLEISIKKQAASQEDLDKIKAIISDGSSKVEIRTKLQNQRVKALIHYIIKVPKIRQLTFDMKTINGKISLNDVKFIKAKAETVNGLIDGENMVVANYFNAKSKNGDITVNFKALNCPCTLSTSNGNIKLIASTLNARACLKTTTGKIENAFPLLKDQSKSKKNITADIGTPPLHKLDLSTITGNIRLEKKSEIR